MNTEMSFALKLMLQENNKIFFGPGVASLLKAIEETGSVKDAAESMSLSYTKAWTMIRNATKAIGENLVYTEKGGIGGGRSHLTESGKDILEKYNLFQLDSQKAVEEAFRSVFQ